MEHFDVLDKGYIKLIDVMGSDETIIQAARVSYGKGTKTVRDNESLLRYLMRNKHTSPFEMCEMVFEVKLPIFVARQWIRHRTANVNEISARYSILSDDFYIPKSFKEQSKDNKQGSGEDLESESLLSYYETECNHLFSIYETMLEQGVSKEQARMILPLSTYTRWIWKCDLRNILHFLMLRLDEHAQYEIREYAKAMSDMVKDKFPVTYRAFEDYILYGKTFSRPEQECIEVNLKGIQGLTKREEAELKNKMRK